MRNLKFFGLVLIGLLMVGSMGMNANGQVTAAGLSPVLPPAPGGIDYVYGGPTSWSTVTHTITNTATDTVRVKVSPTITNNSSWDGYYYSYQSLTFGVDISAKTGTANGVFQLWGTNVSGTPKNTDYGYAPIASYTVTNAAPQNWYTTVTGNPYSNYMVTGVGVGTTTLTYKYTYLAR